MGQRTADTREVTFEDVRIPARFRLGKGMDGFKIAMMTLDESRATVGAAAVGIARAALEVATDYAKERVRSAAHRRAPGHPVQAGRHGHEGERRTPRCWTRHAQDNDAEHEL